MEAGRIAQAGSPRELYERPATEFVAGFMGEAMLFDGQALADGTVRLGPLTVTPRKPVPAGPVKVAVRPEAWRLSAQPPEGAACLPALRKLIAGGQVSAGETVVLFNTGSGIKYLEAFE